MAPHRTSHRYKRRASDDPNRGQLAWTLFVGFVVALCALLQVSIPKDLNRGPSPMVHSAPAGLPFTSGGDRQPAATGSGFN